MQMTSVGRLSVPFHFCMSVVYRPDSTYLDSGELQNSFQRVAPVEEEATALSLALGQGEMFSLDPGNSCFARQGCHSTCSQVSAQTRCFLCQPVLCAQDEWDVPSHPQRSQTECVHSLSTFQNGDGAVRASGSPSLGLDLFHRSDGSIPARTDASCVLQIHVPKVGSFSNRGLLFQGAPVRTEYCTSSIHPNSGVRSSAVEDATTACACLPGRLAFPSPGLRDTSSVDARDCSFSSVPGLGYQSEEVVSHS